MAASWNLGVPATADAVIKEERLDLVYLGRPALSNPHWPVWAARELGYENPFGLVPEDWGWWLRNFRGHQASIGLPEAAAVVAEAATSKETLGFKVADVIVEPGSATIDGQAAHAA